MSNCLQYVDVALLRYELSADCPWYRSPINLVPSSSLVDRFSKHLVKLPYRANSPLISSPAIIFPPKLPCGFPLKSVCRWTFPTYAMWTLTRPQRDPPRLTGTFISPQPPYGSFFRHNQHVETATIAATSCSTPLHTTRWSAVKPHPELHAPPHKHGSCNALAIQSLLSHFIIIIPTCISRAFLIEWNTLPLIDAHRSGKHSPRA